MKMNVDWIMRFEGGEMNDEEIIEGIQDGINTGLVWKLQVSYGRLATRLIEAGLCKGK